MRKLYYYFLKLSEKELSFSVLVDTSNIIFLSINNAYSKLNYIFKQIDDRDIYSVFVTDFFTI